jgi:transcriptional repressor NrdR
MRCPYCGSSEHKVVDKRDTPDEVATRRRRECLDCNKRFTTYERVEEIDIFVIKRDGTRVPFSRTKLLHGIAQSCHKRPVSVDDMQKVIDNIEHHIRRRDSSEIKTSQIGAYVMKELKKVDKVAYIRFASVYKAFEDVKEFEDELKNLKKKE